jgi:hypothetical protein
MVGVSGSHTPPVLLSNSIFMSLSKTIFTAHISRSLSQSIIVALQVVCDAWSVTPLLGRHTQQFATLRRHIFL